MMRSCSRPPRALYHGGDRGSLAEQIDHRAAPRERFLRRHSLRLQSRQSLSRRRTRRPAGLSFWNGFGGFTGDGREYVIVIDGTSQPRPRLPPAPWANVLANPQFGCLVTEGGLGYSLGGQQSNEPPHSLVE